MSIENLNGYGKVTVAMKNAGGPEKYLFGLRRNAFIAGVVVAVVADRVLDKIAERRQRSTVVQIDEWADAKMEEEDVECLHPLESLDFTSGNYVSPYGWETYPGWYCLDCGESVDDPHHELHEVDPDFEIKYEKENPR